MTNPMIGPRIRLRELREDDLAVLVPWWQDPDVLISQTTEPLRPRPADMIAEQYRMWNKNAGTDVGLVVVSRDEGTVLGHVALFGADAHNRTATYAIVIGPPHQNQGYGTEATTMMLRYGFSELGLHKIQLNVIGYNERAIHTYEKAGFVVEGRDREVLFRGGAWHDVVRMGILDREWNVTRAE